jgi:hypothetical protein
MAGDDDNRARPGIESGVRDPPHDRLAAQIGDEFRRP